MPDRSSRGLLFCHHLYFAIPCLIDLMAWISGVWIVQHYCQSRVVAKGRRFLHFCIPCVENVLSINAHVTLPHSQAARHEKWAAICTAPQAPRCFADMQSTVLRRLFEENVCWMMVYTINYSISGSAQGPSAILLGIGNSVSELWRACTLLYTLIAASFSPQKKSPYQTWLSSRIRFVSPVLVFVPWCHLSSLAVFFWCLVCFAVLSNSTSTSASLGEPSKELDRHFERNDTTIGDFIRNWRIICYNVEAFPPSPVSCASQVVPWGLVGDITRLMGMWTRMGFPAFGIITFCVIKRAVIYPIMVQIVRAALFPTGLPLHTIITWGRDELRGINHPKERTRWILQQFMWNLFQEQLWI